MAMMGQPIQQCSGQFGITEHIGPFGEAQVSSDNHAGSFIQFAEQGKQPELVVLRRLNVS